MAHIPSTSAPPPVMTSIAAGDWLITKARRQAVQQGVQSAATNLRKQGVPLDLARRILLATK